MRTKITAGGSILILVLTAMTVGAAVPVGAAEACGAQDVRRGSWIMDVSYNASSATVTAHELGPDGRPFALVAATVGVHDGLSNTFMIGEVVPHCADVDGDGLVGVAALELIFRETRTGQLVSVVVTPIDGELDDTGEALATSVAGGRNVTGPVRTDYWVFGTELPS